MLITAVAYRLLLMCEVRTVDAVAVFRRLEAMGCWQSRADDVLVSR